MWLVRFDLEEAFDTVWQPDIICRAHEIPNLSCEDLGLVSAMLAENQVSVRTIAFQSEAVPCHVGVPEGRKLSPAFFVAAASVFSKVASEDIIGVGLDPRLTVPTGIHRTALLVLVW